MWIIALFVIYWRGTIYGQPFPLNTFLPGPLVRGCDLFLQWDRWQVEFFTRPGYGHLYFPFTYLPVHLLTKFGPWNALFIFYASVLLPLIYPIKKVLNQGKIRGLNQANIALILFFNYPVLIMLYTGNFEGWIYLFIFLSFVFSLKNQDSAAAVSIGLAIAMKGVPILMIPFLFNGRSVTKCLRILGITSRTVIFSTLFSMLVLPYGRNISMVFHTTLESQKAYRDMMVLGESGIYFGHSFLNGVHAIFGLSVMNSNAWILIMAVLGMCLLGVLVLVNFRRTFVNWKFAALLACISCFFVPTSTDYKLTYFLPAVALFCVKRGKLTSFEIFCGVMMALIISPKPWGVLPRSDYLNAGVWLTPILICALMVGLCVDIFRSAHKSVLL